MKKIFAVLLMLAMALCASGAMAASVSDLTFVYDEVNHTAVISDCDVTAEGALDIPKTVTKDGKEYTVTGIGEYAFYHCEELKSVTIPEGVTSIGNWAFANCYDLESVTIPESLTGIGNYAFYHCSKLTGVDLPDGLTSIGYAAFHTCWSLTSMTIPEKITSILAETFRSCENLKSVTFISATPPTFDYYSFGYCDALEMIEVPEESLEAYAKALESAMYKWNAEDGDSYCDELLVGSVPPMSDDQEEAPQESKEAAADLPRTGDASQLGAWIALLGMSAAGMKLRRKNG